MKNTLILFFLFVATNVFAANQQGLNGKDVQNMMQKMQEMQTCMGNINQPDIENLKQRSEKLQSELKSLCVSGKRQTAQKKAIAFSKEVSQMPIMKTVRKCSKIIDGVLPKVSFPDLSDDSNSHICDSNFGL